MEFLEVPEIDDDHRRLALIVDRLDGSLMAQADSETVLEVLSELVDTMCSHIEREEELMRSSGYRDTEAHARHHDEIINMLDALVNEYRLGFTRVTKETGKFMKIWRDEHMGRFDRPLAKAIKDARIRSRS